MELIDILEVFRDHLVEFSILIFEFIGVGIIIVSGIHGFYLYLKKSPDTKLALAEWFARENIPVEDDGISLTREMIRVFKHGE